ncbi:MAG: adenosylmethionine decarboxylase [Defluviitoga tunisiensis]|jgi:S-adenosylmethionine decarboxylase|uniref:S-adenosylmethionine decarboxylase proenzyme n=1 Tax=Defluviitoga tunisiensis TaxID=1006576 RepID=A0A0C7P3J3_DEFTU|nr:adenosylmethionine decarboxylase [Defluviitoga tunisiensis]MDD3600753.1 adenosylmethionine decarboxylase [Defluviitoga tunisiensis]MDY0379016.1 adenosylmethionine decarboxylase [Defluviitoga tunisiensis]CEP78875.1 S-adenosylmethionine decarboxylase [Defluviitoga tunisiensis]HHV01535.1 S-adenosylmethionine decarboxylase proenzyme [Defluviitoga tunisiensis]HOP34001.1 adenosylmethionine decarboxylase [Defluviitoga tunisiensis]
MAKFLGRHLIAELYDCDEEILNNVTEIEYQMTKAAIECGATIVTSTFHRFLPHGVSGAIIISESHLAIHTWPEYKYASLDIYTCGDSVDPWVAFNYLKDAFKSGRQEVIENKRGMFETIGVPNDSLHKVEVK